MKTTFLKKQAIALTLLITLFLIGCGDNQLGLPPQHGNPPPPPVVVSVDNLPGAAIIHFQAPAQYDLLAITATYEIHGTERIVRASIFNNSLRVEGFGSTDPQTIMLRSVDNSRNESAPVAVTVNPLTPPVETIFETIDVRESFGGIRVNWENAAQNNIIISVAAQDEYGIWNTVQHFFSSERYGTGTVRGLPPLETAFRITVRDRWDNFSEVHTFVGTPWFEQELPVSRFREVLPRLPGDAFVHGNLYVRRMWSRDFVTAGDVFHTRVPNAAELENEALFMEAPQWPHEAAVTFDLGQLARVSRFRLWQRRGANHQFSFQHNNIRTYSVYGAAELTPEMRETGSLAYWTHLVDVVGHRPSGGGIGSPLTQEDRDFADMGEEIEIPIEAPPVRYIRILMRAPSWGGGNIFQIQEIEFWGEILEAFFP